MLTLRFVFTLSCVIPSQFISVGDKDRILCHDKNGEHTANKTNVAAPNFPPIQIWMRSFFGPPVLVFLAANQGSKREDDPRYRVALRSKWLHYGDIETGNRYTGWSVPRHGTEQKIAVEKNPQ